jgi:hypothetical protein
MVNIGPFRCDAHAERVYSDARPLSRGVESHRQCYRPERWGRYAAHHRPSQGLIGRMGTAHESRKGEERGGQELCGLWCESPAYTRGEAVPPTPCTRRARTAACARPVFSGMLVSERGPRPRDSRRAPWPSHPTGRLCAPGSRSSCGGCRMDEHRKDAWAGGVLTVLFLALALSPV